MLRKPFRVDYFKQKERKLDKKCAQSVKHRPKYGCTYPTTYQENSAKICHILSLAICISRVHWIRCNYTRQVLRRKKPLEEIGQSAYRKVSCDSDSSPIEIESAPFSHGI